MLDLAVSGGEEKEEIFRVRVIGVPSPRVELEVAFEHLFLKSVVVGRSVLEPYAEELESLCVPVYERLRVHSGIGVVEGYDKGPSLSVPAVLKAGLREKPSRFLDGFSRRFLFLFVPVVNKRVYAVSAFHAAEDAGRNRPHRGYAPSVREYLYVFLVVEGYCYGAAEFLFILRVSADSCVEHVESRIVCGRTRGCEEAYLLFLHNRGQLGLSSLAHCNGLVETVGGYAREVVIALKEFVPSRDVFLFEFEDYLFEQRQGFPGVVENSGGFVSFRSFGRVSLKAEVFVLDEGHLHLGLVGFHPEGAGAYGEAVKGDVSLREDALPVKDVRLLGHGGEKRHREPVDELRVFGRKGYPERVRVYFFDARETMPVVVRQ